MATGVIGAILGDGAGKAVSGIGDGIAKVINAVRGRNPEDAEKLQELVSKHEDLVIATDAQIKLAQMQSNVDLNKIAGENVRADAQSGDKYTARARPSIIYVGVAILFINYGILAFLQRYGFKPVDFPSMFWETWGIVATGVVVTRTLDKAASTALSGQGGSVKGLGINLESKGD